MSSATYGTEKLRQSYLRNELESLGLMQVRLNEFNDSRELGTLVSAIKESMLAEYRESYPPSG